MLVTLICPNLECGQTVVAPDGARGKVVRCAHCQQAFMVPIRDTSISVPHEQTKGKKQRKDR